MTIDKRILDSINNLSKNTMIIGPGGCGKSHIIKQLLMGRDDIIAVAPSGIAAKNINGKTIQSFFGIFPHQYTYEESKNFRIRQNALERIRNSNILLIDEISMIRCEILDIVNEKLQISRGNNKPFGGMKLLFLGDFCQMECVVLANEEEILNELYPYANYDFSFYNSYTLRNNNYFDKTFDILQLNQNYRHKNDPAFCNLLKNIRLGNISHKELNMLNTRYKDKFIYDENYQYLTVTNSCADKINRYFLEKMKGTECISRAIFTKTDFRYYGDIEWIKTPFRKELRMKEDMKIMFVKNDNSTSGQRWVNGSIGLVKKINFSLERGLIRSVLVEVDNKEYEVQRESYVLKAFDPMDRKYKAVGSITQFPFVPAYAITIDKSQGLTLDKVAIVMNMKKKNRDNQIYVALSRAKRLEDIIILESKIKSSHIKLSSNMKAFMDRIAGVTVIIEPVIASYVINIENNYGTVILNNAA